MMNIGQWIDAARNVILMRVESSFTPCAIGVVGASLRGDEEDGVQLLYSMPRPMPLT